MLHPHLCSSREGDWEAEGSGNPTSSTVCPEPALQQDGEEESEGLSVPWWVLRMIPRGSVDAHLLRWGLGEDEPHFLSQKAPREMLCCAEANSPGTLVVGGLQKPGRRVQAPTFHTEGLRFPLPPGSVSFWPWKRAWTLPQTQW